MAHQSGAAASGGLFLCQKCCHPLEFVGTDAGGASAGPGGQHLAAGAGGSPPHGAGSSVFAGKMDESFVVLPEAQGAGGAARTRGSPLGGAPGTGPGGAGTVGAVPGGGAPRAGGARRGVDESFIVLPPGGGGAGGVGGTGGSGLPGAQQHSPGGLPSAGKGQGPGSGPGQGVNWDARAESLRRVFEIASDQTQVDHPLCLECAAALREELEMQVREAEADIEAYRGALQEMEADVQAVGDEEFRAQVAELEREEAEEAARLKRVSAQLAEARAEREGLEAAGRELAGLEDRYWHDFSDFKLQLQVHLEERDGLLARMEGACAQLEVLKGTNVYNDAFHIWHDGPFGTINGFRLGRLPGTPVEWDEINAAWGQACLLLHTMAQACKFTFSAYRLLPMGSYPRIACNGTIYELCGPVNFLWNQRNYDKAMTYFLACLKEFADFASARDQAHGRSPAFDLPYKIDGDKVGGRSIRQGFPNKDEKWTAALQWMLTDLKVALSWLCS